MMVLVCGGRDYEDTERVFDCLDSLNVDEAITCIVAGGAYGADEWARLWAKAREIPHIIIPAQWKLYGKSAGYKRNAQMLRPLGLPLVDMVVAFPGGVGTAMMVQLAQQAGTRIWIP